MTTLEMTSNQPYLFRAIYDWIIDNELTPYVLVDAMGENVKVPPQSVQNGQIVLNIAPRAVTHFHTDNDALSFSARFSGVAQQLYIPMENIMAIYAAENGQGMVFSHDHVTIEPESSPSHAESDENNQVTDEVDIEKSATQAKDNKPKKDGKSFLKVVK